VAKWFLKGKVLLMRRFRLLLKNETFNRVELGSKIRLSFPPFFEVVGELLSFLVERPAARLVPTLLCHIIEIMLHDPPIFKTK
jgi:hypothetical protein